ncbi:MAG TPA: TonB-dependent receptor [Terriglobia bacterium]|nr:TonB-dependent receptor [Terriglobia bacterium]
MKTYRLVFVVVFLFLIAGFADAQSGGAIRGSVSLKSNGTGLHKAAVRIVQLGRVTDTREDGTYELTDVPPGVYDVIVTMPAMDGASQSVTVQSGASATADFALALASVRSEVTVTASGREQLTLDAFQTVTSLDALELAQNPATSLGEALDGQPGVAKRSSGPGSSRPVVRGFDGDRILVLQDGAPAGGLGFQSGDHAEPVNTSTLERVEVLKGPATLLYGSNAIGGVVNAVSAETNIHEHPHEGLRGFASGFGGSNNDEAGGSASFDLGTGKWRIFGNGGAQRAGAYHSAEGEVANTQTRVANGQFGVGRDMERGFFSVAGGYDDGLYGVAGSNSEIDFRRYNARLVGGIKNLGGGISAFRAVATYTDWQHSEIEDQAIATTLQNKQWSWRGVFEQERGSRWSGSFGFSGIARHYEASGEETLAPPTDQNSFAAFILEEIQTEHARFQLGGRLEHSRYSPDTGIDRQFTGLSAGAGIHVGLWNDGAFVANFTTSYRAPALEELYNNGPHPGNRAFEIGNENLTRERSNGIDLSLRHQNSHVRAEANFFYYDIGDFVFLDATGGVQDDLNVYNYAQANSRFVGTEAVLDVALHPSLWLNLGMDAVDAKIKATDMPLPRIPPLRGRAGFEFRRNGLSVRPEVQLAQDQDKLSTFETRTPGYAVFNLKASYSIVRQHAIHMISANFFNMGDRLYRNHVSFVKDVAPEIGRGVSFGYSVRFF